MSPQLKDALAIAAGVCAFIFVIWVATGHASCRQVTNIYVGGMLVAGCQR